MPRILQKSRPDLYLVKYRCKTGISEKGNVRSKMTYSHVLKDMFLPEPRPKIR
jgi:hypothetical protein